MSSMRQDFFWAEVFEYSGLIETVTSTSTLPPWEETKAHEAELRTAGLWDDALTARGAELFKLWAGRTAGFTYGAIYVDGPGAGFIWNSLQGARYAGGTKDAFTGGVRNINGGGFSGMDGSFQTKAGKVGSQQGWGWTGGRVRPLEARH